MRTDTGIALLLAIALGCAWPSVASDEPALADQSVLNEPTVGDVLERIERYQRIRLQSARTWYKGLERMDTVVAELELALLEVHGPEPVRNRHRGLERMGRLYRGEAGPLPEDVRLLLRVLASQQEAILESERTCHQLEVELAREQQEHRETQDRLRALRMIERQLEDAQPGVDNDTDGRERDGRS
jgi:hypothetical protein